jgi:hypothetical protein
MNIRSLSLFLLMGLILLIFRAVMAEEALQQAQMACIKGTVWYRNPADGSRVPYPHASIAAWRHGTRQGLAKTRADKQGRFCIELPLGVVVDLRVWGLESFGGTSVICRGAANKIELGPEPAECGGDCVGVDITTECTDQIPRRRRP